MTHLLTGGDSSDALSVGFGAAAVEATMAHLNTGDAANDQLVASLIGGAVSSQTGGNFNDGATSGAFAESFNRQMHDAEIQWIKENAQAFADKHGLTQEEAEARLTQQALKTIDYLWGLYLPELTDTQAAEFLQVTDGTFVNEGGDAQALFTAQGDDYLDRDKYLNDDQAKADFYRAMIGYNAYGLSYDRLLAGDFSTGKFTEEDRKSNTREWKAATAYNLHNLSVTELFEQYAGEDNLDTLDIRADFYGWALEAAQQKGSEVKWPGAAQSAVSAAWGLSLAAQRAELVGLLDPIWGTNVEDVDAMIIAANDAILADMSPILRDVLNGPVLIGDAAKEWDSQILWAEQTLVQPIYDSLVDTPEMGMYEDGARGNGNIMYWALIAKPFVGAELPVYREPTLSEAIDRYNYGMRGMGYLPPLKYQPKFDFRLPDGRSTEQFPYRVGDETIF